jgi:ABC-2 type transport system permease protein
MRPYLSLFRIRFINGLQYRAAALAGLSTQFAWGFMLILGYMAFYRANPDAFPMELSQMVSYVWMQQAFLVLYSTLVYANNISESIEDGAIAYEMVRPVDLYSRWLCQISADRLSKVSLRCIPVLFVGFILPEPFRMSLPANPGVMLLFLISTVLALGVVTAYSALVYITVFYTLSLRGIRSFIGSLSDFLSGAIIPLPFFPGPFRTIAELLPFAAMQNAPLRIYSGNLAGAEAIEAMLLQVFWLVALLAMGRIAMKRALGRVVVQGG